MIPQNVKTQNGLLANAKTGETFSRCTATFTCTCPACGDEGPHAGVGETARASKPSAGSYVVSCRWCGESWEGPAVIVA